MKAHFYKIAEYKAADIVLQIAALILSYLFSAELGYLKCLPLPLVQFLSCLCWTVILQNFPTSKSGNLIRICCWVVACLIALFGLFSLVGKDTFYVWLAINLFLYPILLSPYAIITVLEMKFYFKLSQ